MIKDKLKNKKLVRGLALAVVAVMVVFFLLTGRTEPVEAFIVSKAPFSEKIIATGQLGLEQELALVAEVSGNVEFLNAKENQILPADSVLLEIEKQTTSEYESAKSEFDRASSRKAYAALAYENTTILYKEGAVSENEMKTKQLDYESALSQFFAAQLALQQVAENLSQYRITVPWDAVVLKIYVNPGDFINVGDRLADIGSTGGYRIRAELDEKYFPYIQKGLPVVISVGDGYSGAATAKIDNITPKINANTGTFEIELLLPEDYPYKASNLTVNLEITVNELDQAIAIPKNYIFGKTGPDKAYVLIYKQGVAVQTQIGIEPGISSSVLVSEGLSEGDILLLPQEGLGDGDAVKKYKEASAS